MNSIESLSLGYEFIHRRAACFYQYTFNVIFVIFIMEKKVRQVDRRKEKWSRILFTRKE